MEAKETIMNEDEVDCLFGFLTLKDGRGFVIGINELKTLKERQAEISFKAGREQWIKELAKMKSRMAELNKKLDDREIDLLNAKQAGIKEVVEWVNERHRKGYLSHCGFYMLWDKKLNDWGVKEV